MLPLVPALRRRVEEAGRDPDAFPISLYMCPIDAGVVGRCAEAGVERVIFLLPADDPDAARRALDDAAGVMGAA